MYLTLKKTCTFSAPLREQTVIADPFGDAPDFSLPPAIVEQYECALIPCNPLLQPDSGQVSFFSQQTTLVEIIQHAERHKASLACERIEPNLGLLRA